MPVRGRPGARAQRGQQDDPTDPGPSRDLDDASRIIANAQQEQRVGLIDSRFKAGRSLKITYQVTNSGNSIVAGSRRDTATTSVPAAANAATSP